MSKPVLVIMAAGLGSRYGGLKQMDPISDQGEIFLDFSLYDAALAGFEKAIFTIKTGSLKNVTTLKNMLETSFLAASTAFWIAVSSQNGLPSFSKTATSITPNPKNIIIASAM